MMPLLMQLVFDRIETAPMPFFARPIARAIARKAKAGFSAPRIAENLDAMEAELGRSEWFAGEAFSAADIQMSYPIEASQMRAGLDATRPKLMAYLSEVRARPAYQRAIVRGGGSPPIPEAAPPTARVRYPNRDSPSSWRADSSAGTAGRSGAGRGRWADRA